MEKKKIKVLIVEDDPDIGNMISMILEYNQFTTFVLQSAEGVNEFIKSNRIEFIIMDMLLSGTNGTDICAVLKNDEHFSHIPLIMMSAHPDAESLCMKAGANDFVSKPFDLDDLMLKIGRFTGWQPVSR